MHRLLSASQRRLAASRTFQHRPRASNGFPKHFKLIKGFLKIPPTRHRERVPGPSRGFRWRSRTFRGLPGALQGLPTAFPRLPIPSNGRQMTSAGRPRPYTGFQWRSRTSQRRPSTPTRAPPRPPKGVQTSAEHVPRAVHGAHGLLETFHWFLNAFRQLPPDSRTFRNRPRASNGVRQVSKVSMGVQECPPTRHREPRGASNCPPPIVAFPTRGRET